MSAIPILLYHSISDSPTAPSAPFTVKPADFARHMDVIVARGYRCMTMSEFIDARRSGTVAPDGTIDGRKIALVTFDDGYLDFIDVAMPVLTERNLPSTIYITTGWMRDTTNHEAGPSDPMMSFSQLSDLRTAGVEIGAHSHAHLQMDTLNAKRSLDELERSKKMLEDTLGVPVRSFAYPHGYSNARIRRQIVDVGYESAAAVRNALSPPDDDPLRLARLMLMADTSVQMLEKWLDGTGAPVAAKGESLQTTTWRAYRRAKAIVTAKPGSAYR